MFEKLYFFTKHSIAKQYKNSFFGSFWAFANPIISTFVYYLFFIKGLRFTGEVDGVPMILFILSGNICWTLLSGFFGQSSSYISKNKANILASNISISFIILIEMISSFVVHLAVLSFSILYFYMEGQTISIHYLNFFYYWIIMFIMFYSFSYIVSILALIFKDLQPLIASSITVIFLGTPVLWVATGKMIIIQKIINPFYFFISGYRETLIKKVYFFENIEYDIYIWIITLILVLVALLIKNKYKETLYDLL